MGNTLINKNDVNNNSNYDGRNINTDNSNSNTFTPNRKEKEKDPDNNVNVYKAVYDYTAREKDDLSFKAGDKIFVLNKLESGWWKCKNLQTNEKGLVPSNYITIDGKQLECQDWWFTCTRRDAIKQLAIPGNKQGTFLIRESTEPNKFALSVRQCDDLTNHGQNIKHYHILKNKEGMFFLSPKRLFPNLIDLVKHYQETADGICCKLTTPCPKEVDSIPFKNLEVERSAIVREKCIGKGSFGEVWKGLYNNSTPVAIKTLIQGKSSKDQFLEEAKVLHKMRHKNLVQLMGVCSKGEPVLIIMEFLEHGSLRGYLLKDKGDTIKFKQILDIAAQIACGMTYLEEKNYIHRDLRSINCLVGKNKCIKIADFGLAKITETYYSSLETPFPIRWTAPEGIEYQKFTIKSDVWSFGVVLYELVTYGESPYERDGVAPMDILGYLMSGKRLSNPSVKFNNKFNRYYCPSDLYNKMLECWSKNREMRPTFASLLKFFESYCERLEEKSSENRCE